MSILKKISLAVAAVAVFSASSFAGQVLVGGNIPLINTVTGIGVLTLDLASAGTGVSVATFIVNCNAPTYDVNFTVVNGGHFRLGTTSAEIPMSAIAVVPTDPASGTLGTGGTAPNLTITPAALGTSASPATPWHVVQTTATENYTLRMTCNWASASTKLAGLYTESILFTIAATL